jgi:hypothetical protein
VVNISNHSDILEHSVCRLFNIDSTLRMKRATTIVRALALLAALSLIKAEEYPFEVLIRSGMPEDAAFPFGAVVNQVGGPAVLAVGMPSPLTR